MKILIIKISNFSNLKFKLKNLSQFFLNKNKIIKKLTNNLK